VSDELRILQLIPAPAGLTAICNFGGEEGDEAEAKPVVALALVEDDDGRQYVNPVVIQGTWLHFDTKGEIIRFSLTSVEPTDEDHAEAVRYRAAYEKEMEEEQKMRTKGPS
jgi:hypothetical protein